MAIENHPSPWMYNHLCTCFPEIDKTELNFRIQEFLKFMYISSVKGPGYIPLTKELDNIWHEYILQTREYEALCMNLPGKVFIHHQTSSLDAYVETRNQTDVVTNMVEWLPYYYFYFGEFTEKTASYWTMVRFLNQELHLSLQEINQIAKDEAIALGLKH